MELGSFLFSNVVWDCQPCLFGTLDFDWINPMDRLDFWDCMDDCFWFKWALENRDNKYRDEEEFRKVMDGWNRAGFVAFIIGIVLFVIAILILIFVLVFAFNSYNNFDNGYRDFGNY